LPPGQTFTELERAMGDVDESSRRTLGDAICHRVQCPEDEACRLRPEAVFGERAHARHALDHRRQGDQIDVQRPDRQNGDAAYHGEPESRDVDPEFQQRACDRLDVAGMFRSVDGERAIIDPARPLGRRQHLDELVTRAHRGIECDDQSMREGIDLRPSHAVRGPEDVGDPPRERLGLRTRQRTQLDRGAIVEGGPPALARPDDAPERADPFRYPHGRCPESPKPVPKKTTRIVAICFRGEKPHRRRSPS
jgi:hypothetical protein